MEENTHNQMFTVTVTWGFPTTPAVYLCESVLELIKVIEQRPKQATSMVIYDIEARENITLWFDQDVAPVDPLQNKIPAPDLIKEKDNG